MLRPPPVRTSATLPKLRQLNRPRVFPIENACRMFAEAMHGGPGLAVGCALVVSFEYPGPELQCFASRIIRRTWRAFKWVALRPTPRNSPDICRTDGKATNKALNKARTRCEYGREFVHALLMALPRCARPGINTDHNAAHWRACTAILIN